MFAIAHRNRQESKDPILGIEVILGMKSYYPQMSSLTFNQYAVLLEEYGADGLESSGAFCFYKLLLIDHHDLKSLFTLFYV